MKAIYLILVVFAIIVPSVSQPIDYLLQKIESVVTVGNLTQQEVTADLFRQQTGLRINVTEDSPIYGSTVMSFSYMRASPKAKLREITVKGANFTIEVLADVTKSKPGDVVYIDNIRVSFPDGSIRIAASIIYKLI